MLLPAGLVLRSAGLLDHCLHAVVPALSSLTNGQHEEMHRDARPPPASVTVAISKIDSKLYIYYFISCVYFLFPLLLRSLLSLAVQPFVSSL